jgi:hypothetical protein
MRVHSHATDKSSLGNKAHNPNNSATRGYSLTAFSVPLLPRPQLRRRRAELSSPSVESPERKWIARVRAKVLIENKIEATFLQETDVRF